MVQNDENRLLVKYCLQEPGSDVELRIYDNKGSLIRIVSGALNSGSKGAVTWDGKNQHGKSINGVYYLMLRINGEDILDSLKKIVVVKYKE